MSLHGASLPPGQQAILKSFAKHGAGSLYQASDIMDLRVCRAMVEKGLLRPYEAGNGLYELDDAGVKAMEAIRG